MEDQRQEIEQLRQQVELLEEYIEKLDQRLGALDRQKLQRIQIERVSRDDVRVLPKLKGQLPQVRIHDQNWTLTKKRVRGLPDPDHETCIELTATQGPGAAAIRFIVEGPDLGPLDAELAKVWDAPRR